MYDLVNAELHDLYGWRHNAYPERSVVEEYLAAGHSVQEACEALNRFIEHVPPPPRDLGLSQVEWASFHLFGAGGHWRALNTAQALGLAPLDPPADVIQPARNAQEALAYAKMGRHIDGSLSLSFATPEEFKAEMDLREEFYATCPADYFGIDPHLLYCLVLWGICPRVAPAFGTGRFRPELYEHKTLRDYLERQLKSKGLLR